MESTTTMRASVEATLHLWRTAAQAVATDPRPERRGAYEAAIACVFAQLAPYTSMQALMAESWTIKLWSLAAAAGLNASGKVLNYQVVAAAACWQRLCQVLGTLGDAP